MGEFGAVAAIEGLGFLKANFPGFGKGRPLRLVIFGWVGARSLASPWRDWKT